MFYNIRTMMLDRFMEAVVEDKKELIVQEGVYEQDVISSEWEKFMIEYHSIVKDANYKSYLNKTGRIAMSEIKIQSVINIVTYLMDLTEAQVYSPVLFKELEKYGYPIKFTNEEQYLKDLENILVKLKAERRRVRVLTQELEESKNSNEVTYDQFGDTISAISDKLKVVVNPSTTSVWTYLFMVKRLLTDKTHK